MPDLESFDLAIILTAAGATVGAALITGFIGILKKLGGVGAWVDASREPMVSFALSALLVAAAYYSTSTLGGGTVEIGAPSLFAAFLAWYGIAQIAMGVHDTVSTVRSKSG
jgi:hypothetical protein